MPSVVKSLQKLMKRVPGTKELILVGKSEKEVLWLKFSGKFFRVSPTLDVLPPFPLLGSNSGNALLHRMQERAIEYAKEDQTMELSCRCHCPEGHETHLCQMKKEGKIQEVKAMSKDPAVSCLLCEGLANSADYVCSPLELL